MDKSENARAGRANLLIFSHLVHKFVTFSLPLPFYDDAVVNEKATKEQRVEIIMLQVLHTF